MKSIKKVCKSIRSERGATMIEYAVLAVLVAIGSIGSITYLGKRVDKTFNIVSDEVAKAGVMPSNGETNNAR